MKYEVTMVESIEHTYVIYIDADSRQDAEDKAYEDESIGEKESDQIWQHTKHYEVTSIEEIKE